MKIRIVKSLALVLDALREIFDESAYQRFLIRRRLSSTTESYAAFWAEHEKVKARRPRCC